MRESDTVHICNLEGVHMRTVAVTINKGGVGKTTLTKNLATAATDAGYAVLILDMDTQENSTGWGQRRMKQHDKPLPMTRFTTEKNLDDELARAEQAGCDLVLIDTPPGRNSEAPAAVESSDLVLIPFWNDQDAYEGVARTAMLVKRLGKSAYGVLNFATPNSRSHEETARLVLEAIPLPMAPVVLHRYDAHRLANPKGLTAQELEPNSTAAQEISALWDWFGAVLQLRTGAHVHKGAA
jgi:chromosome partitioning protein